MVWFGHTKVGNWVEGAFLKSPLNSASIHSELNLQVPDPKDMADVVSWFNAV